MQTSICYVYTNNNIMLYNKKMPPKLHIRTRTLELKHCNFTALLI